ncbi:hypothetical protein [Streptomyces sp. NPDC060077]|uniref:hypothetical protein n=1 Tax=Streptomyces sp. NPDC060077 TaxID=3347052 RepID=UPI003668E0F7
MRYADGGGLTAAGRAKREAVRFEAAEMFELGVRPPVAARRLRVSRKSAYAWHPAAQLQLEVTHMELEVIKLVEKYR